MFREKDLDRVLEIAVKYASFDSVTRESDLRKASSYPRGFWVAEDRERIVGFVYGHLVSLPEEVLDRWRAKKVANVELLAVVPEYRRRGIGRALLERLSDEFRRARVDMMTLSCPAEAVEAAKLYTNMGFEVRFQGMRKRF
jgi:ribosomal-protein-alanine N-acetyltransferase